MAIADIEEEEMRTHSFRLGLQEWVAIADFLQEMFDVVVWTETMQDCQIAKWNTKQNFSE